MIRPSGPIIVFLKEMKDILRDRRTIISMMIVPILVYPVIFFGFGAIVSSQIAKTQAADQLIMVLPSAAEPQLVAFLSGVERARFIGSDSVRAYLLSAASHDSTLDVALIGRVFSDDPAVVDDTLKAPLYYRAFDADVVRAVVEAPKDFFARLGSGDSSVLKIFTDETDLKSGTAGDNLRDWIDHVRDSIIEARLIAAGMDRRAIRPVVDSSVDVAPAAKKSGYIIAGFLPYVLIILMLTGGMYPALDITAGEKERNTLETLLVAPVSRWHLAVGKFLAVFVAGLVTVLLATISLVLTFIYGASGFGGDEELAEMASSFTVTPEAIAWVIVLMIPTAVLFSSILIAISIAARSYKEGQSYATPLIFAAILPAMMSMVPGIELNFGLSLVPIVNICMALKEVLMGTYSLPMLGMVFLSTAVYAVFALFVATRLFERESILFRT